MKLTKRCFCLLLSVVLMVSCVAITATAAGGSIKTGIAFVDASALCLRSGASTGSRALTYAYRNEVVVLLGKTGSWYKVSYNNQIGYMHSSYLKVCTVENVELGYGRVNDTHVNMRSGPGTGYSVKAQSNTGDLAYVIGINKQWYKVIYGNTICYIRTDYLDLIEAPYENRASAKSPLFFRGGKSLGITPSASVLKASSNYMSNSTASGTDTDTSSLRSQIITTAKKYQGVPYVWGGTTPSGFDCSGYTQYVFKACGITLSRTCEGQYATGKSVEKSNLQPGDLVFFYNTSKTALGHVGIYVGDGKFIHASTSKGIYISDLTSPYYTNLYYGGRSVL